MGKRERLSGRKIEDLPLPPASTLKILTALVVLDHSRTNDLVTIPAEAAARFRV